MSRLRDTYKNDIAPALMKKFEYASVMQIPKLDKVVINVGAGDAEGQRQGDRQYHRRYHRYHRGRRPYRPTRESR